MSWSKTIARYKYRPEREVTATNAVCMTVVDPPNPPANNPSEDSSRFQGQIITGMNPRAVCPGMLDQFYISLRSDITSLIREAFPSTVHDPVGDIQLQVAPVS